MTHFEFHGLDRAHERKSFDCGVPRLNDFLEVQARQSQSKGFNRTYVALIRGDGERRVKGFYAISMGQVDLSALPEAHRKSLPKHPVPIGRIARLAVDKSMQGKGLGRELLVNAMLRIRDASAVIGAHAIVVDAKDAAAKRFYEKFGFIALVDDPLTLFLPLATLDRA